MKKSVLIFMVTGLIVLSCLAWFLSAQLKFSWTDLLQIAVLILILVFAVFIGIKRFRSERRGQPAEDELTKNIMRKASSLSYFISIYWWLALMYFSEKIDMSSETLIGTGILGMAVLLAVCYLFIYWRGLRDA